MCALDGLSISHESLGNLEELAWRVLVVIKTGRVSDLNPLTRVVVVVVWDCAKRGFLRSSARWSLTHSFVLDSRHVPDHRLKRYTTRTLLLVTQVHFNLMYTLLKGITFTTLIYCCSRSFPKPQIPLLGHGVKRFSQMPDIVVGDASY